jgi:hypothetical protein
MLAVLCLVITLGPGTHELYLSSTLPVVPSFGLIDAIPVFVDGKSYTAGPINKGFPRPGSS